MYHTKSVSQCKLQIHHESSCITQSLSHNANYKYTMRLHVSHKVCLNPNYKYTMSLHVSHKACLTMHNSTNNKITLCIYCLQLFPKLSKQLHTIVHNIMRLFYDCYQVTRCYYNCKYYTAISKVEFQEAIKI